MEVRCERSTAGLTVGKTDKVLAMGTQGHRSAYRVIDDFCDGIDGAPNPCEHFHFESLIAEFPDNYHIRISKGLDPCAMLIAPEEWEYSDTEDLPDAVREGDEEVAKVLNNLIKRL